MHTLLAGTVAKVAGWILPTVMGPLVYAASKYLLNLHAKIDALPAAAKRVAVVLVGIVAVAGLTALGVQPPTECLPNSTGDCLTALMAPTIAKGVSAALVAMICHALKNAPTTPPAA